MVTKNVDIQIFQDPKNNLTKIKYLPTFLKRWYSFIFMKYIVDVLGLDCQMGEC
jgi:hypothetical protein